MEAGKLDRAISLIPPALTRTPEGETTIANGSAIGTCASVRQMNASEAVRNGYTVTTAPYVIEMRYRSDVKESWQIGYMGRTLGITSITEIGRREGLQILATEVKP